MWEFPIFAVLLLQVLLCGGQALPQGVNCSQLPQPMKPKECCDYPELFRYHVFKHCRNERSKGSQCHYACIFDATEICRRRTCQYMKAEDYVDWVMKREDPFADIYKAAYKKCIDEVKFLRPDAVERTEANGSDCDPVPEILYLCVQNEMFTQCPLDKWRTNSTDCVHKRDFITNCVRQTGAYEVTF